jgi:hypothetical protein
LVPRVIYPGWKFSGNIPPTLLYGAMIGSWEKRIQGSFIIFTLLQTLIRVIKKKCGCDGRDM